VRRFITVAALLAFPTAAQAQGSYSGAVTSTPRLTAY
jgi:uncharacterized transporter YbjL